MAENVEQAAELIRESYEAFNEGDFERASRHLHPDIVWNRTVEVEQPVRGAEAARELMKPQAFSGQHNEIHQIDVIGDHALVEGTFHAVGASSGIEFAQRYYHLWRIRDGLAVEFTPFRERDQALRAMREAGSG